MPSLITHTIDEAVAAAEEIGYPVVLRPAFTLGGTGGGFADDEAELREFAKRALSFRPCTRCWLKKSIKGYKEIEYEVMRDANDTAITICNMENIDPVGIHGRLRRRGAEPDADEHGISAPARQRPCASSAS